MLTEPYSDCPTMAHGCLGKYWKPGQFPANGRVLLGIEELRCVVVESELYNPLGSHTL